MFLGFSSHGRDLCLGIMQTLTEEPRVSCHSLHKGSVTRAALGALPCSEKWKCITHQGCVTVLGNPPCQTEQQSALWRNCWWIRLLGQERAWIYWRDVVRCNSPHFVPETAGCGMQDVIVSSWTTLHIRGCEAVPSNHWNSQTKQRFCLCPTTLHWCVTTGARCRISCSWDTLY